MTDQVPTGVGAELEQARKAAGLAIADVAQQLKLLPRQIESLEHERFERLPGPTIARGMVRSYACLLKLDPEPLIARMAPGAEKAPERGHMTARHREQVPSSTANRRSTLLYVGFSVVLLGLVGAMAYEWQREKAAPQSMAAALPVPPAAPEASPAIEEKPVEKPPVPEPAASERPPAALAKADTPARPKPEVAVEPALPPGIHRLVLRMEDEAWLEVRDGAGTNLVSSLNSAGSERAVRGRPPFQLVIGNAHHVELTYDGEPVDLKPYIRGEVARFTLK